MWFTLKTGIVGIVLLLSFSLRGQDKVEREYRINTQEVPNKALSWVNAIPPQKNVKWYKEESSHSYTIEAKTKIKGQKFSIEFDSLGHLEDVEIEIKFSECQPEIQNAIKNYLKETTEQYSISKIQKQLTGNADLILKEISTPQLSSRSTIKFELVVKVKVDGAFYKREYTFDAQGQFEKKRGIIVRNTDNLDY